MRTDKLVGHTPGPWHVRVQHPGRSNTPMYFIAPQGPEPGTCAVAKVIRGYHSPCDANAKLIAAAPDLLAVCKLAYAELDDHYDVDQPAGEPARECPFPGAGELMRQLQLAIKKAEA